MLHVGVLSVLAVVGAAGPRLEVIPDERGVLREVRVDGRVFVTDLGVSLTAPGWAGHRGDQRSLAPASVVRTAEGGAMVLAGALESQGVRTRLRQTIRPIASGMRLEYELLPESDVEVENVLLMGRVPVEGHAGSTRYFAAGEDMAQGTCPATLNAPAYIFLGGRDVEWLALVGKEGSALRLTPDGLALALQDDRKFGGQSFGLQGHAGGRRTLKAGQPVRFALSLTADTAATVEADARKAAQSTLAGVALAAKEPLRAGKVAVDHPAVDAFDRVEMIPEIQATFDNPFDPDDIAVDAEVTLPNGKTVSVPGFYYVPFRLEAGDTPERLRVAGPAGWRVRFTPTAPGTYKAVVKVRDRSGEARCPAVTFTAKKAERQGFVRVSERSPGYFRHDDGTSYFAVGENICWAGARTPLKNYTDWFKGLGAAGGNWARLWLAYNEKGLEWMPAPTAKAGRGTYLGLGRYSPDNSWRLDEVVRLAEENDVRLMFCFGTYGELLPEPGYWGEGAWVSHPYNAANGGPCKDVKEFWTNAEARKRYQQRLRYIVARWGYSPTVFAWEFWNEQKAPAAWVGEMAAYLKKHDVNRHLVSTTYGDDPAWRLPEVDFTMTHHYGDSGNTADLSALFAGTAKGHRKYAKPYFPAEFGIDWRTADSKYDPEGKGQSLHNGLWSSVMSGCAGTAMLWYWDGYVHPKNLYHVFTPVAKFVSGIDWAGTRFEPLEGVRIERTGKEQERFTDMDLVPESGWGRAGGSEFTVGRDGTVAGGSLSATVGSPTRHTPSELHQRLTFHLEMPADGEFITTLGTVSSKARLQIRVDGEMVVDEPLATGPAGEGPWKAARYQEQWKLWQCDYDKAYAVKVPAGKHTVTLENAEGDWLTLRGWRIPVYRSSRYPDVEAYALRGGNLVLLWLRHRQSNWRTVLEKKELETLPDLRVTVPGLPAGAHRVEWWDTYEGKVIRTDAATVKAGALVLTAPPLTRDVAAVVRLLPAR